MNTKKVMSAVTAAILAMQLTANGFGIVSADPGNGQGTCTVKDNPEFVEGVDFNKAEGDMWTENEEGDSYTYISENGTIHTVYVKTGGKEDKCFIYTSDTNEGPYTISGIGTEEITVTENWKNDTVKSENEYHDISHTEYVWTEIVEDEDDDPILEEDDEEEEQEENNNDDTSDDTEEETTDEDETIGAVLGVATEVESEKQGEVLGATELADTGVSLAMFAQMGQAVSIAVLVGNAFRNKRK